MPMDDVPRCFVLSSLPPIFLFRSGGRGAHPHFETTFISFDPYSPSHASLAAGDAALCPGVRLRRRRLPTARGWLLGVYGSAVSHPPRPISLATVRQPFRTMLDPPQGDPSALHLLTRLGQAHALVCLFARGGGGVFPPTSRTVGLNAPRIA